MTTQADLTLVTAEALQQLPQGDEHTELVRGEVREMTPASVRHGRIAGKVVRALSRYLDVYEVGDIYVAEAGFILSRDRDTVRVPDVAFVSAERAAQQADDEGYFDGPPDLAVEVISPSERDAAVQEKISHYLEAGTKLVWIIRPRSQTITVYRSLTQLRALTIDDVLDGEDVLPGFTVPVTEIFE